MKPHLLNLHSFTRCLLAGLLALATAAWSSDAPALKDASKDHFLVGTAFNHAVTKLTRSVAL
jgi:hypothetical protein